MKKVKNIMKFPTKVTKSRPQLKTRIDHVGRYSGKIIREILKIPRLVDLALDFQWKEVEIK